MRRPTIGLGLAGVLVLALAPACEEKKPEPPSGASPVAPSVVLPPGLDAGLGEPSDPPAPAGDLKTELERFVNLDACVRDKAHLDPLVGDALGAIGYDTFLRDACRMLEAAKDRRREACEKIDASALRARCLGWVAMIAETPDACPLQYESLPTRGRLATCVAVAAKDPRLCAGEGRAAARATCTGLVLRDPARCDALGPNERAGCQREIARWRALLPPPLEGLADLAPPKARLTVHGANGTPDPPTVTTDVAADFARGLVIVTAGDTTAEERTGARRYRVELGTIVESEASRFAASLQRTARVGLAVVVTEAASAKVDPVVTIQKLELELPGEAPIVAPPASSEARLTTVKIPGKRGAEAHVTLEATVSQSGKSYRVELDVTTFVRDVVAEGRDRRILPPVHPRLPR